MVCLAVHYAYVIFTKIICNGLIDAFLSSDLAKPIDEEKPSNKKVEQAKLPK